MGKRLSISQPAVIQTELRPLDESFWVSNNGSLEQWYYQNTGVFSPDRQLTPLTLTAELSAIDRDTNTAYTPSFQIVQWLVKEWDGTQWVTRDITSLTTSDPYYLSGDSLVVRKNNYDATHAINITCKAQYQDPRDTGVLRWVETSLMLTTSIDSTQVFPNIDIKNPSARAYNPLKDDSPIFEFEGTADWSVLEGEGGTAITEYKADALGTEEIIQNNEEQVINAAPLLDVVYGDIDKHGQQFMYRQTAGGEVSTVNGGVAAVKNIKGDTAKIVSLIQNGNFANGGTNWSVAGGTVSVSNGEATITVNETGTIKAQIYQVITGVTGHKFYQSFFVKASTSCSLNNRVNNDSYTFDAGTNYTKTSRLYTLSSGTSIECNAGNVNLATGATFTIKNFVFLDLTAMGIDSLTTVEQVDAWLSSHIGNLGYIPYTKGKLVNYGGYSVRWNQLVDATTTSVSTTIGHKYYTKIGTTRSIVASSGSAISVTGESDFVVDLTLMFGAGNEPDLEWCDKYLSRDYYDYCPSVDRNIMDVMEVKTVVDGVAQYETLPMGVRTVGFNLFDEQFVTLNRDLGGSSAYSRNYLTNKNPIKAEPNKDYCFYVQHAERSDRQVYYLEWDASLNLITRLQVNDRLINYTNSKFTLIRTASANAAYIGFFIYSATNWSDGEIAASAACVNISDASKNGTYEAHWSSFSDMSWITKIGIENFNIWDEEWEEGIYSDANGSKRSSSGFLRTKNYVKVSPDTKYFYKVPTSNTRVLFYDANYALISSTNTVANSEFTTPNNCKYLTFFLSGTTYAYNICINKSIAHFNGCYYPYGMTAPYFPQGLCKAGDAVDEVKVENGKIKGVARIEERAHSSGDESDTSVITDGTKTYYALSTPYEFEIDYPTKGQFMWYGVDGSGNEVPIDTLPVYSQATQPSGYGQHTSKINVNALYGEDIAVILRVKRYPWSANVLPPKVTKSVAWKIPPINVVVMSDKGSAVRAQNSSTNFTFSTIVNQQGEVISDEKKQEHMVFDWYYVKYGSTGQAASPVSAGSGLTKAIAALTLKNTSPAAGAPIPSTSVYCEAFLLGAYHLVDGQYVRTKD